MLTSSRFHFMLCRDEKFRWSFLLNFFLYLLKKIYKTKSLGLTQRLFLLFFLFKQNDDELPAEEDNTSMPPVEVCYLILAIQFLRKNFGILRFMFVFSLV